MTSLDAPHNEIADLAPLFDLGLSQNPIRSLDTLRLSRNRIVDPAPLGTVPTLLILDVFGNRISDVSGLAQAPLLQELQLGANPLRDLTPLVQVRSLVDLGLDETDSTRLTGIEDLRAAGVSVNGLA